MDKIITIHDVARELGVSASTVSRAISGKGRIGENTRKRVLAYIDERGFYPNAAAKSLARAKTNNIAIVLPKVKESDRMKFFYTCMYGAEEIAQKNDYDIIVILTDGKDTKNLERLIRNRKVDGMILFDYFDNDYCARILKDHRIPFMAIGACTGSSACMERGRSVCKMLLDKINSET